MEYTTFSTVPFSSTLSPLPTFYSQSQARRLDSHLFSSLSQPPTLSSLLIAAASLLGKVWALSKGSRGGGPQGSSTSPGLGLSQLVGRSDSTSPSPTLPLRNQRPLLAQNPRAGPCNCKLIIQQILLSPPSACGGPSAFCWLYMCGF